MKYFLTFIFFLPNMVLAQGFVTCQDGGACNFCHLMSMVNDLVEWVIIVGTMFTVLILAYAGFLLIVSQGDARALAKGKKIFFQCLIGILIMLAAWTLVDTTIKMVAGGELGMWNEVQCGAGQFDAGTARDQVMLMSDYHLN